jgi:hypothetical protein
MQDRVFDLAIMPALLLKNCLPMQITVTVSGFQQQAPAPVVEEKKKFGSKLVGVFKSDKSAPKTAQQEQPQVHEQPE